MTIAACSTPAASARALLSPTFTLTWSTGPLADAGQPIAESSPDVATLDADGPAVVVGDRRGFLYAYHLADGSAVAGWPVDDGGVPIDSSPSVLASSSGTDSVFVGAGNAADPGQGGYEAYSASGAPLWFTPVTDPSSDEQPAAGVQASLTVGDLEGTESVVAGSLDQEQYAVDASTGSTLTGWPFFTSDSVFSTAAVADLYGTGTPEIVEGGDQTAGFAIGRQYLQGGHLRILNQNGGVICDHQSTQTVDSSPAVGPFLPSGSMGIAVGTGRSSPAPATAMSSRPSTPTATRCGPGLSTGPPRAAPPWPTSPEREPRRRRGHRYRLGRIGLGPRRQDGCHHLDGAGGRSGHRVGGGRRPHRSSVPGCVGPHDLGGGGSRRRVGTELTVLSPDLGFQNSPLVTDDPNGDVGITVAGYDGTNQGEIRHYEITGSDGAAAVGATSWPMFHHDPQRTGVSGVAPAQSPCTVPSGAFSGYTLVGADGGAFAFGSPFCGSAGALALHAPVVGAAKAPDGPGYWLVGADGGVFAFGGAPYYGSMSGASSPDPSSPWPSPPTGAATGWWVPTAVCSPSATPGTSARCPMCISVPPW